MTYDELAAVMRELRESGHLTSMPATGFGMPTLPPARVPRPGDPGLPPQGMTVARQPTPPPSDYEQYVDRYRHGVSPGEAATELGLAAAPLALGPLGRLATASPKATGAVLGALGLGTATEAGEPAKGDPRIEKLRAIEQEIRGHRSALEKQATTNFQSKTARDNAAAPYLQAIQGLEGRRIAIESELDDEAKATANSSFAKAHPTLNAMWPTIQWGAPLGTATLVKGGANVAERALTAPWRHAVSKAEEAILSGDKAGAAYHAGNAA